MKINQFLKSNRAAMTAFVVVGLLMFADNAFGFDLNPQSNPFGTRGDQALGGFGANVLTIVNAVAFYGGIVAVFWSIYNMATQKPWMLTALGAVGGLGGWTIIGAVAYQLGSSQAFQIPGV